MLFDTVFCHCEFSWKWSKRIEENISLSLSEDDIFSETENLIWIRALTEKRVINKNFDFSLKRLKCGLDYNVMLIRLNFYRKLGDWLAIKTFANHIVFLITHTGLVV